MCPGSGKPTNIVSYHGRPFDFLCSVCGYAVGSRLAENATVWTTPEHRATDERGEG